DLVGVFPRQPVGVVDVKAVEGADGHLVTQAFQGGAEERLAAGAVVEVAIPRGDGAAVVGEPLPEGLDLAGDGAVTGLLSGGDPGVQGDAPRGGRHGSPPEARRAGRVWAGAGDPVAGPAGRRRGTGQRS